MKTVLTDDILSVICSTLAESKDINILSVCQENNTLFCVYINDVSDSISFLSLPEKHFEITIDNVFIQCFELGYVLYNIYFNGALKFLDILYSNVNIIEHDPHYIALCDLVTKNIPLNIAKVKFLQACSEKLKYENDVEKMSMLIELAEGLNLNMQTWYSNSCENFVYVQEINNENDFILAQNSLNAFIQWLKEQTFTKISEKIMNDINQTYVDIQILYMKV